MEVECKYRITDRYTAARIEQDDEVQAALLHDFADCEMDAVYYDTAEGLLSQRHWSLRLRSENGLVVAACKKAEDMSGAAFAREEWQTECDGWDEALPALVRLGAPAELGSLGPLLPRCRTRFTRRAAPLRLPDGSTVELAMDEGYLEADGKREGLHELEIELLSGSRETLTAFGETLARRYDLTAEHSSKYARALRLLRSRG